MKMNPLNQDPGTTGVDLEDFSTQSDVIEWIDISELDEIHPGIYRSRDGGLWVLAKN